MVCITASIAETEQYCRVLAPEEMDRATRFQFDHLRRSFILVRGALRVLLGRYLNCSPDGIRFGHGLNGKPRLKEPSGIEFNVSHSGGLALFGFTSDCQIGIDVEQIRPVPEMQEIADQFFCADEAAELKVIPANTCEHAFFLCWTRKEAFIKAIGDGLSAPLNKFRVTLQPGEPARILHLANDRNAGKAWTMQNIDVGSDYAAALAYCDTQRPLRVFPLVEVGELLG